MQEACDEVRTLTKTLGFTEREVLHAGKDFNWGELMQSAGNMSLFAERKLIELRLGTVKLEQAQKDILLALLDNPSADNLILISSPRLEKPLLTAKWFTALESKAAVVQLWPVTGTDLPGWISRRLQSKGMSADREALQLLADRVEGNLLAASQEIEKLQVLHGNTTLDARTIAQSVADSSRFTVFELVDNCLLGRADRALNILHHLKAEGEEHLRITNAFIGEIRTLALLREQVDEGHNVHGVVKAAHVWYSRTAAVENALGRLSRPALEAMLQKTRVIELSVKGSMFANPWDELQGLVMDLSGLPMARLAG
jgi:DNA polymerase-3 subunit delta